MNVYVEPLLSNAYAHGKKNAPGKKCKTFKELQNFWTNQLLKMFTLNLNRFPYS